MMSPGYNLSGITSDEHWHRGKIRERGMRKKQKKKVCVYNILSDFLIYSARIPSGPISQNFAETCCFFPIIFLA